MRHRYECQLRWADLDQLRHVNNVLYADYLQEARIDFLRALEMRVAAGPEVPDRERSGLVVVRHEMTYLAPLHFGPIPVSVEMWVSDLGRASFTLGCEIFHDGPEGPEGPRTVYLRARTRIAPFVFGSARPRRLGEVERAALAAYLEPGEPAPPVPRPGPARRTELGHYLVHVRFSDLDPYQHVNNVKYLEYFQEGRVLLNSRMWRDLPQGTPRSGLVVAQGDYDYLRPLVSSRGGYDLWTWVERVGTRSVVMGSEIHEGTTVMARARVVLVFVDGEDDRSSEPDPAYRAPLMAALEAPDDPGLVTVHA